MAQATCSVALCDRPAKARGWCAKHYQRWRSYGDPAKGRLPRGRIAADISKVECFWHFITRDANGCWLWIGARAPEGYGRFTADGETRSAHRYSYELLVEPIPEGLHLDHLCRVRHCVNPAHLEPVTCLVNVRRGERGRAMKTHCPQGHPYEGDNLLEASGRRYCRTCRIERSRRWRENRKAA